MTDLEKRTLLGFSQDLAQIMRDLNAEADKLREVEKAAALLGMTSLQVKAKLTQQTLRKNADQLFEIGSRLRAWYDKEAPQ